MPRKRAGANGHHRREIEEEAPQGHRAHLNTFLDFWRVCGAAPCRRAHACRGDADACFGRHWPMVSEEFKVWFRAMVNARSAGRTPQEVDRIAMAEVARWRELMAQRAAPAAADHVQASPDEHPGSRESAAAVASPSPNPRLRSV